MNIFYLIIVILAVAGLAASSYLTYSRRQNKPHVCLPGSNCAAAEESPYGKIFGIPLEILGIPYFLALLAGYGAVFLYPELQGIAYVPLGFSIFNTIAELFSLYFLFAQIVFIPGYCAWCLSISALPTLIYALAYFGG
ncbi:hypothetical protein L0Y49_02875 [bacterium]|nr:hypothetical protein [bacterium]MCI0565636.1 hypothetical protein [bacterium]MCI0680016.1 hypothetical protein [bacterium]